MAMFKRRRQDVPGLNTTSTADISFMLLIFFLVTSSMDTDKGLTSQLPPPQDTTEQQEQQVKERNVMQIELSENDVLTCGGDTIGVVELSQRVHDFVANSNDDPKLPEMSQREVHLFGLCKVSDRHIITIQAHRLTSYDAYFEMQNAITRGYNRLRDELALQRFGHGYAQCSQEEHDAIGMVYPKRISEYPPEGDSGEEGGAE